MSNKEQMPKDNGSTITEILDTLANELNAKAGEWTFDGKKLTKAVRHDKTLYITLEDDTTRQSAALIATFSYASSREETDQQMETKPSHGSTQSALTEASSWVDDKQLEKWLKCQLTEFEQWAGHGSAIDALHNYIEDGLFVSFNNEGLKSIDFYDCIQEGIKFGQDAETGGYEIFYTNYRNTNLYFLAKNKAEFMRMIVKAIKDYEEDCEPLKPEEPSKDVNVNQSEAELLLFLLDLAKEMVIDDAKMLPERWTLEMIKKLETRIEAILN